MFVVLGFEIIILERNESRIVVWRKRSFLWSDVYSGGVLRINIVEVLKGSILWCVFFDLIVVWEIDLCLIDLWNNSKVSKE